MNKQEWLRHAQEAGDHDKSNCSSCKARLRTKRANTRARERDEAYRSLGLVKVRGAQGGIYWE